jgi:outer membrane murein-binding lipoprotein Lpp
MKNLVSLLKENIWKVSTVVFALLFLSKGCTNNKIATLDRKCSDHAIKLEKKIDSLERTVAQMASAKEVRDEMERTMFDYLIYEDDVDKGKTSLSEIKNKIEAND